MFRAILLALATLLILGKRLFNRSFVLLQKTNTGVHSTAYTLPTLEQGKYKVAHTGNHVVVALQNVEYDEAELYCQQGGGKIAAIQSSEEDKKIMEKMKDLGVMHAWIGFRRHNNDWNQPYWELKWSVDYIGWAETQPTKPPNDDDYVIISLKSNYRWKDGWHDG